jgi:hypothetical protein
MRILGLGMPHCYEYKTAGEFNTAYQREVLRRARLNAQRNLRDINRYNTSKWTKQEREALEKDRRDSTHLVEAIPTPSYLREAGLKQLGAIIADLNRRIPGFYPTA